MSLIGRFIQNTSTADIWNYPNYNRAIGVWNMILKKPTSIVINREGVYLNPQTVRIEYLGQAFEQRGAQINTTARESCVVLGVKNHPSLQILDTDIRRGDRFYAAEWNMTFDVVALDFTDNVLVSATANAIEDH